MNKDELQAVLAAWDECCEETNRLYSLIEIEIDEWDDTIVACCGNINALLEIIIVKLTKWASECSGTWTNYLCQLYDPTVKSFEITFNNYVCAESALLTTTTTTAVPVVTTTTTTTIDPNQIDWSIVFSGYECVQENDSLTTTTTLDETVTWTGTWGDFLCQLEDNPAMTSTTTTGTGTTTTTTTVAPGVIEFFGTWEDFLCQLEFNASATSTTTTTTTTYIEGWSIEFGDYQCVEDLVTTTTTAAGTTTTTPSTTLPPATTTSSTTTTTSAPATCGNAVTGGHGCQFIYNIDLGATPGMVTLTIDTNDAPDKFVVRYNGSEVINSGYRGDSEFQSLLYTAQSACGLPYETIAGGATGTFSWYYDASAGTNVIVEVNAPLTESDWEFTLSCPATTTTTTTAAAGVTWTGEHVDFVCELEGSTTTTTSVPTTTTTTLKSGVIPTTTTTTTGEGSCECENTKSGGYGYPTIFSIDLTEHTGTVNFYYNAEDIPDKFIVEWDGSEVINTGYRGDSALQDVLDDALTVLGEPTETISGNGIGMTSFEKTSSVQYATVKVYAPVAESEWLFTIYCPEQITTTTTSAPTTTTTT